MKKLLLLAAGLSASLAARGQTAAPWTQVWSDEFNGPTLDLTKWSYETGTGVNGDFGTGQLDRATARPENVAIEQGIAGASGGALRISTRRENYLDRAYTSGRINTKDKAFWGPNHRIVARVWPQGVRTQGQGFAFWMLGNEHPAGLAELTWPQVGEIDIMEYVGAISAHNLGTVHYAYQYNNNQYASWNHGAHGAYYSFAEQQLPDSPEFIRVDLGASYLLDHVRLNWENNGRNYLLETSADGTTWQPAYRTSTGPNGVSDVTFTAVSARFVRVTGTLRVNQYGYSLYELEVFAAGSPTNLALRKPATSSSVENATLGPNLAVDGDAQTRWSSAFRASPQYQAGVVASPTDPAVGANGWHTYGIDWYDDRLEFFVDDNVYHVHYLNDGAVSGQVDGQNEEGEMLLNGKKALTSEYSNMYPEWHPFEHKMYAILSAGVGGSTTTYGGPITSAAEFPANVYIDWVRVYERGVVTAARPAQAAAPLLGYPNPVASTYQLPDVAEGTSVTVVDATGRTVLQTQVRGHAVDVGPLRAGVYVLRVPGPGGERRMRLEKR